MKRLIWLAMLAFATLAACTDKDADVAPHNVTPPPPPPSPGDSTSGDSTSSKYWADTAFKSPVDLGTVAAPCIYVTVFDIKGQQYTVQKYSLDGKVRQVVVNATYSGWPYWHAPGFSSRGEFMTLSDREGLHVRDMRTNASRLICELKGKAIGAAQFSADNEKLAFFAVIPDEPVFGDLYVVDHRPGAVPVNLTKSADNEILSVPAFSPDGKSIAYTTWGTLYVTDVEGNQRIEVQKDFSYWTDYPFFTPDGRKIIYTSDKGHVYQGSEIYVTDVAEGAERNAVKLTEAKKYGLKSASSPMLSPDGNTLYFVGETYAGQSHLYSMPIGGGKFTLVTPCVSAKDLAARLTFVIQ